MAITTDEGRSRERVPIDERPEVVEGAQPHW